MENREKRIKGFIAFILVILGLILELSFAERAHGIQRGSQTINKSIIDSAENSISKDNEGPNNKNEVVERIVYLTFDDGPSDYITDKILDVLKVHNVKGTFFIVGKEIKNREEVLKRIYAEGHGIGLHTYSHSFKKVYVSHDAFIKEMVETNNSIKDIIGIKSTVIRFPGGSHHRLDKEFLEEIHESGFKVFDWTHNSQDGVYPHYSPKRLYRNSLEKIISKKTAPGIIILMHCNQNNQNTIKALPLIIKHFKDEGCIFKVINQQTPEYYSE